MNQSKGTSRTKSTIRYVIFLTFAIVSVFANPNVQAQAYVIGNGVFSNGGGHVTGEVHMIVGTVGQPCIGVVSNTSYNIMSGILHDVHGVLSTDVFEGVERISSLPTAFNMSQNYPNPFNPTTTIDFALPIKSQVNITLYNTLGQKVTTLVDKQLSAGEYEVTLNGSGLSSGVYFYRIVAGDFVQGKKLVLLK